jgi:ADP-heptose:LPS heptosyltransferase
MVKSIETASPEVLVLFPGSLGDFICVLPALEQLKTSVPNQCLAVAVRGQSFEIASRIPWISQVLSLDRGVFAALFSTPSSINTELIQLFSTATQVVSWFGHSSPEVYITLEKLVRGSVRSFAFFHGQGRQHACQYYLRCLGSEELRCPSLVLEDKDRNWLATYFQMRGWHAGSHLLVLHPGSGGKKKRWAVEGFIRVARWWKAIGRNRYVIILLGPAEEHEEIVWRNEGIVEHTLPLQHVGALLSRADVYVGNDSGVSHFAGALGARGVVLFGPTSFELWRPLGGALTVVANSDYRKNAPDEIGMSVDEITPEAVIAELTRISGAG